MVSASLKLDKIFKDAEKDEKFYGTQTFDYRNSNPEKYRNNDDSVAQNQLLKNSQKLYERSPVK